MTRNVISLSFWTLILLLMLERPAAFAQQVLTLDEAYHLALSRSEQIQIAQESVIQAEGEKRRAKSFIYPKVTADLSYLRRPDPLFTQFGVQRPESETEFNLVLEQSLYSGGRATATYRIAKREVGGKNLDLGQTKESLLFNVAQAYYEALKAQKNVAIEENEVKRLEEHRRDAEKRFRVGEATKTVLLRAEAELSNAKAKLIRAKNNESTTRDQLALLAGVDQPFELADPPFVDLSQKSEREWIETANENRIDLQRRSVNIDIAREGIDFARGVFHPFLSLEGQYTWLDQDPQSPFLVQNDRRAILKLAIPIFEGGLRVAELSQARSRLRQSLLEKQLLKNEIAVEVRRAILNLSALTSELEHLKAQVAFARDNFSLVSRQFAVGLATNIDVLDANATLIDAERQLSNTLYDREVAILQLKKTVGLFLKRIDQNEGAH